MTKLKELKEYIQKEIPEIKKEDIRNAEVWDSINEKGDKVFSKLEREDWNIATNLFERKITLEDVLRLFIKTYPTELSYEKIANMWEWQKPLDQQSEETTNFLWDLLIRDK